MIKLLQRFNQMKVSFKHIFFIGFGIFLLSGCHQEMAGVLDPKGVIAHEERILLFDALALMLIVVLPVIIMSFVFVFKYRASHKTAEYKPNWCHSYFLEGLWWGIPIVIVVILGILAWQTSHKLDPYRPIDGKPVDLEVQVIALPWKWLFIYPNENIATVNELVLPKGKQIQFFLTGDNSAMGSFFVPQLGSQIYTMAGMRTQLHLIATEEGTYRGLNSQFNGDGFSGMHFPVRVVDEKGMTDFISKAKASPEALTMEAYQSLRLPSENEKTVYYSNIPSGLFDAVINYYMGHENMKHPSVGHETSKELPPEENQLLEKIE